MIRNTTFQSKRAQIRIERLLALLAGQTLPASTIAEKLYCDQSMATEYLRHLRSEPNRRVRIAGYDVINGTKRPLYGLGSEPDAPMTRKTNVERHAAVRADPARLERRRELSRQSYSRRRAQIPRQRDRRVYDPPLPDQVLALLGKMPGYTTEQIAQRLDANQRAVQLVVQKLRREGKVRRAEASTMKAYQWETPGRPMAAVPKVPRQTIFAALGI
jgi:predicted transcriptional regulator